MEIKINLYDILDFSTLKGLEESTRKLADQVRRIRIEEGNVSIESWIEPIWSENIKQKLLDEEFPESYELYLRLYLCSD